MTRESFLAGVRDAAQRGRAFRVPIDERAHQAGYVGASGGDLVAAMAQSVEVAGGVAHVAGGWEEAGSTLMKLLDDFRPASALCWEHATLERLGLRGMLEARGVRCYSYASLHQNADDARREILLAAEIGISAADLAVAETGSLVLCSGPGQERTASLLPPVHVAVVARDQIVPDLLDAFAWLTDQYGPSLPTNVCLVTGPSKTGDIELELTTGVHGPGQWHVILVRGDLAEA